MSDQDKELLARIGQLAGQINRHKNQQSGVNLPPDHHPSHYRRNVYRHASAPYLTRGNRVQRGRRHQHRTLHFNSSRSQDENAHDSATESSGWVTRNDRHRQLINANVFEKESQNRTKAIEATRKRKEGEKRRGEKARFNEFLSRQQSASAATNPNTNTLAARNEIVVEDIRFRVMDGGKKLARISGDLNSSSPTPKVAVISGVKFYRTKTGNLVVNRIVQDRRRSGAVKKTGEPCKIFSTSGSCPKGPQCRYIHDPDKVALCKAILKEGKCPHGDSCDLSHDMTPERVPNCLHYAKGHCAKTECPFTHSKASPNAPVCKAFGFLGYCEKGAECTERHVFECPDFSNTGRCNTKGCKLLHRERASVLRGQAKPDEVTEDISSDEEAADSDDVDSDEVAEFIEADSDVSDIEDRQDFIPL